MVSPGKMYRGGLGKEKGGGAFRQKKEQNSGKLGWSELTPTSFPAKSLAMSQGAGAKPGVMAGISKLI